MEGHKLVLHIIPSGILHDHCMGLIGHGVVFDPAAFQEEVAQVQERGFEVTPQRLRISSNCCVITSYNKLLDIQREAHDALKIGTTGRGIGPTYEDKIVRKAIKLKDLLNEKTLLEKLKHNLKEKEILFKNLYGVDYPAPEREAERLAQLGDQIAPFMDDTFHLIDKAQREGKKILYEGAQGILLDIDYGSYPFVTSSHTAIGGIYTGAGVSSSGPDEVLGIVKAYTTRVGTGPFPTELLDEKGDALQTKGGR